MWTVIKTFLKLIPLSAWVDGAIVVAIGSLILAGARHERAIQAKIDNAHEIAAVAAQVKKAAAEHIQMQAQVDKSSEDATNAQARLDKYMADHPTGGVRLCHASPSSGGNVSGTSGVASGTQSANAGSAAVSAVLEPTAGPDISGGITVLVSAAARLAVLEQERQRNP